MKRPVRILCVFVAGLLGCAGSDNLPRMAPVSGVVTLDGQPLTSGQVVLLPEVENKAGLSAATIENDGTFQIHTAGHEGAPLGKYKVAVTPSMVPSAAMAANSKPKTGMPKGGFAPRYSDQKNTPLRVEVSENPKPGAYDLKLTKR